MAKIDFDTSPYERCHRKAPRGRGSWAFSTEPNPSNVCDESKVWFSSCMTYAEAKRWAKAEAKKRFGADAEGTLFVLS